MLKQYRAKMFLSQNDLAKKIGVSVVTVNRRERWKNQDATKTALFA